MRGTNYYHAWSQAHTESALADIKALGANTVRIVISGNEPGQVSDAAEVASLIGLCRANRLICLLDDHDPLRGWTLDDAANYWVSLKDVLVNQENYILINIGNEPKPIDSTGVDWLTATTKAIGRIRAAGIRNVLVIDAPYGQDRTFTMRDTAPQVFASDPEHNVLFSIHMYGAFDSADKIAAYLDSFQSMGLPLIIGEFGDNSNDGKPDADTIMSQANARGMGYLGWSWNGNALGNVPYLDQTTDVNPDQLTPWGQRLFFGPNGVRQTAKTATIYP
ncbi:Cellulase (glycosyl hydrolase family 5) [Mycobacteroides abscessus subsp. abscessus]|nr:Cellulase (glycosyl hydrolase family 5) [Mycobacteroides abscessus subsp. abscessus]